MLEVSTVKVGNRMQYEVGCRHSSRSSSSCCSARRTSSSVVLSQQIRMQVAKPEDIANRLLRIFLRITKDNRL